SYQANQTQIVSGTTTFAATSTFKVQIGGTTPITQYNQVEAKAGLSLAGSLNLSLAPGYSASPGDTYTIISNTSGSPVIGTFAGLPEGATLQAGGQLFQITYQGGADQQDVVLTHILAQTVSVTASPGQVPGTGIFTVTRLGSSGALQATLAVDPSSTLPAG